MQRAQSLNCTVVCEVPFIAIEDNETLEKSSLEVAQTTLRLPFLPIAGWFFSQFYFQPKKKLFYSVS